MTWSIVAREPGTGRLAIAVATRFFAVGALCPHGEAGIGALSTQALINPNYGPEGLRLLRDGLDPAQAVKRLTEADDGRDTRQLHVVDHAGRVAAYTGRDCIGWCGHLVRDGFSVAGNMLVGPDVIAATADSFASSAGRPLAERLLDALDAGQAQGGDKRGKQSAALKIYSTESYPDLDIRVDDHAEPLAELRRLYGKSKEIFEVFRPFLPTRARPAGVYDRRLIDAAVARARDGG